METLDLTNILDPLQIEDLFSEDAETEETQPTEESSEEKKDTKETTEDIDAETLFNNPESVGSGNEDNSGQDEDATNHSDMPSPKQNNFYSSIAVALMNEGILPDLNEEDAAKISSPEQLAQAFNSLVESKLDEKQKRIDEALNVGMEPSAIQQYENSLNYLDNITEDALTDEGDKGIDLRRQLIYYEFLSKGFSKDRALKEVERSFDANTDIEDAKEALKETRSFYKAKYQEAVENLRKETEAEKVQIEKDAEALKKSILDNKNLIGDINVDKSTRQKIYDNISKPVYKDKETGQYYTALQKYQIDNKLDFIKNVGILYTLTNGFKDLESLINSKVKQKVKKGLSELENVINNTSRNSDGSFRFVSGVEGDTNSYIGKGWALDI